MLKPGWYESEPRTSRTGRIGAPVPPAEQADNGPGSSGPIPTPSGSDRDNRVRHQRWNVPRKVGHDFIVAAGGCH